MKNKKNSHFGKDPLFVGGLYELRDYCAKKERRPTDHRPVRLRAVFFRPEDGMVLVGVSFRASQGEPADDLGYCLEVCCECCPCSLRAQ